MSPEAKISLGAVVIGGSSICNASCIHCPTGKAETKNVQGGVMPLDFYVSIVDQLAERCTVSDWISFGLYGDALVDPFIVERTRYMKKRFPGVMVTLNTNGAAYSSAKHSPMAEIVDAITLHIESLRPDVYNFLMRPLRLEQILKKANAIIRDFGKRVSIGTPLHRLNISERQDIVDYFMSRGCGHVQFVGLSNRCSSNTLYDLLTIAPGAPLCRSDILRNFIVDWDGSVFPCCNDFRKELSLGNLHHASLCDVLASSHRSKLGELLDAGDWASIPTCSKCRWDVGVEVGRQTAYLSPKKAEQPASAGADAQLQAVLASNSWRITAPLRALKRLVS